MGKDVVVTLKLPTKLLIGMHDSIYVIRKDANMGFPKNAKILYKICFVVMMIGLCLYLLIGTSLTLITGKYIEQEAKKVKEPHILEIQKKITDTTDDNGMTEEEVNKINALISQGDLSSVAQSFVVYKLPINIIGSDDVGGMASYQVKAISGISNDDIGWWNMDEDEVCVYNPTMLSSSKESIHLNLPIVNDAAKSEYEATNYAYTYLEIKSIVNDVATPDMAYEEDDVIYVNLNTFENIYRKMYGVELVSGNATNSINKLFVYVEDTNNMDRVAQTLKTELNDENLTVVTNENFISKYKTGDRNLNQVVNDIIKSSILEEGVAIVLNIIEVIGFVVITLILAIISYKITISSISKKEIIAYRRVVCMSLFIVILIGSIVPCILSMLLLKIKVTTVVIQFTVNILEILIVMAVLLCVSRTKHFKSDIDNLAKNEI